MTNKLKLEEIQSEEIRSIEDSKPFNWLFEKTQVQTAGIGRSDVYKNRGTHTLAVVSSSHAMMLSLAKKLNMSSKYDVDYKKTLTQSCMLHDLGHPPLGHDGAELINRKFKALGLEEGFSDNNNNIMVIHAHKLNIRDDVIVDTIKYPNKLYGELAEKYLPLLCKSLADDKEYYAQYGINLRDQRQTIACQIMDEADRNSYTCDDMSDYFVMKMREDGNYKIKTHQFLNMINKNDPVQLKMLDEMVSAVNSGSKKAVRSFFADMKSKFNDNFQLTDYGIKHENGSIHAFRESLSKMTFEFYIKPLRDSQLHLENLKRLNMFIDLSVDGEYDQSKHYSKKINDAKAKNDNQAFLSAVRDMVAEVSEYFITNWLKKHTIKNGFSLSENNQEDLARRKMN